MRLSLLINYCLIDMRDSLNLKNNKDGPRYDCQVTQLPGSAKLARGPMN